MSNITVGWLRAAIKDMPDDMEFHFTSTAGGTTVVERRDIVERDASYKEIVAMYNDNGGRFGRPPLTEFIYEDKKLEFITRMARSDYYFTNNHGDYTLYMGTGPSASSYGTSYDERIIIRMVAEGWIDLYCCGPDKDVRLTDKGRALVTKENEDASI